MSGRLGLRKKKKEKGEKLVKIMTLITSILKRNPHPSNKYPIKDET